MILEIANVLESIPVKQQQLNSSLLLLWRLHHRILSVPSAAQLKLPFITEEPLNRIVYNIYNGWYFQSVFIHCKSFSLYYHTQCHAKVEGKEGKYCLCVKIIYAPFRQGWKLLLFNKGLINEQSSRGR